MTAIQSNYAHPFNVQPIGDSYEKGLALYNQKSYAEAYFYLHQAAHQDHPQAKFLLGIMYLYGEGVPQSCAQAYQYLAESALEGNADAQYGLGQSFFSPEEEDLQKLEQAAFWFEKASDQNHPGAKYYLGWMYEQGRGVEQNDSMAFLYYKEASDLGDLDARVNLGSLYQQGRGIALDLNKARKCFETALEEPTGCAWMHLGNLYYWELGEREKGIDCLQESMKMGYHLACLILGEIYFHEGKLSLALEYFRRAADLDVLGAKERLNEFLS